MCGTSIKNACFIIIKSEGLKHFSALNLVSKDVLAIDLNHLDHVSWLELFFAPDHYVTALDAAFMPITGQMQQEIKLSTFTRGEGAEVRD